LDKRTILAFFLCALVLIGFQWYAAQFTPPPAASGPIGPPAPSGAPSEGAEAAAPTATALPFGPPPELHGAPAPGAPAPAGPEPPVEAARLEFRIENPLVEAVFSTEGAEARSITLKTVHAEDQKTPLDLLQPFSGVAGAALDLAVTPGGELLASAVWPGGAEGRAARFAYPLNGVAVEKDVELAPDGYHFLVTLRFRNKTSAPLTLGYTLSGAAGITPDDVRAPVSAVVGIESGSHVKLTTVDVSKVPKPGTGERKEWTGSTFGGIASRYFAMVLAPLTPGLDPTFFAEQIEGPLAPGHDKRPVNLRSGYRVRQVNIAPGDEVSHRYLFFAGPKDGKILAGYSTVDGRNVGLPALLDLTSVIPFAEALSGLFLSILHVFRSVAGSYGIAIILLTVLVRVALHPLSRTSQRSMYKMQKLAPHVKKIQDRYKDKKSKEAVQKMNVEIMDLYKKHGANPIAGCLPTFLQLPVFIGLYNALAYAIDLRQTHFLWIRDLTKPDRLFALPWDLPWPLEGYLNVLPILMVATMVLQQKMQPPPPDEQQRQQQKVMGFMMVIFGFLFYTVPSGLVLYFVTSSLLGILEQRWVRHQLEKEERAKAVLA
jgi:YidC/Oxa1 family membrane protein insertase